MRVHPSHRTERSRRPIGGILWRARSSGRNGTEIPNLDRKVMQFKGNDVQKAKGEASGFDRRV